MAAPTNWATTRGCARLISACSGTISWKRPSGAGFQPIAQSVMARRRSRRGNLFAYRDAPSLRYLLIPAKTRLAERGEVSRNGKAGRRINSPRKKPRGSNICVGHLPLRLRCSAAPTGRKVKTTATPPLSPTVALSLESGRYPAQNGRCTGESLTTAKSGNIRRSAQRKRQHPTP